MNATNRHSRKSVSAVMARFPVTISPMRCAGTPFSFARRYWLIPMGFKNFFNKSSPGVTGLSSGIILLSMINVKRDYYRD